MRLLVGLPLRKSGTAKRRVFWIVALLLGSVAISRAQIVEGIKEYPVPTASSEPEGITPGPDGALWFTEGNTNKIGRITTAGVITEYSVPTANSEPNWITAGPDGALWFTEYGGDKIGRITTAGVITEYNAGGLPWGITAGPDGALWFTEGIGDQIGRITTAGVVTTYPVPTAGSWPLGITAGPDGALWFTEGDGNKIARITTAGVITEYPAPTAGSSPLGITAGPDGALWFTENVYTANKIGRVTTAGVFTEYPVPTVYGDPVSITAGPDGALWFTEGYGNKIGRITTAGVITEYPSPTTGSEPYGITAGPDGALWFTEFNGNKIGQVVLAGGTTSLADQAASLARDVVSAPYLWGGKGWDWSVGQFVEPYDVQAGYHYLWSDLGDVAPGIDCSGLVFWPYNAAFGAKAYQVCPPSKPNPVHYEGADGQYLYNSQPVNETNLMPGDLLFFNEEHKADSNGIALAADHVAMYVGGDEVVEAYTPAQGIISSNLSTRATTDPVTNQTLPPCSPGVLVPCFAGYRRRIDPLVSLVACTYSPVDLVVTDPNGFTITPDTAITTQREQLREVPGILYYSEWGVSNDEKQGAMVSAPILKAGDYLIKVMPKPGAAPTDTYSLTVTAASQTLALAENVPISEIPALGYRIESTGSSIQLVVPVTPTVTFTGAPATAVYKTSFAVTATTNASTTAVITASGACSIVGNTVTMTSGTGTCNLTASWAADSVYLAATASQSTAALKAGSTATITASTPNPSAPGQPVAVSISVAGNGPPTGTVTIASSTGETCTGTLTSGAGNCQLIFLSVGSRTLTATYSGDTNFNGATSAAITQSVNGPLASVSPSSINFGTVYLATITVKSVTVTNQGNAALTISDPFLSIVSGGNSKEFVAVNLCPKSLAAGKSCTIEVTFIAGPFYTPQTATLSVRDNAYNSPQTVALTATVINPQGWLSPPSLNFGRRQVNTTSAAKAVTLTNTGATPLTISSITVAGTNPGDFVEGNNCPLSPASLTAGANCTLSITFGPTAKGPRSGIVVITDNAQLSPQKVLLSGTGD